MRMVFNFKMSLEDYHQMMVSRTFGNSWIRRIILLVVWLVFTGLIVLDLTGVIELTRIVHVCALLVAVSFPAAVITMEINVSKYKDAYLLSLIHILIWSLGSVIACCSCWRSPIPRTRSSCCARS